MYNFTDRGSLLKLVKFCDVCPSVSTNIAINDDRHLSYCKDFKYLGSEVYYKLIDDHDVRRCDDDVKDTIRAMYNVVLMADVDVEEQKRHWEGRRCC